MAERLIRLTLSDVATGKILSEEILTPRGTVPAGSVIEGVVDKKTGLPKPAPNRPFESGKVGYGFAGKINLYPVTRPGQEPRDVPVKHQASCNFVEIDS